MSKIIYITPIYYFITALYPTATTARLGAHIHRPAQTSVGTAISTATQTRILGLLRRSAVDSLGGKLGRCSDRRILMRGWHRLSALGTGNPARATSHPTATHPATHSTTPATHRPVSTTTATHHRILLLWLILDVRLPLLL
jgi:hypothetical protein